MAAYGTLRKARNADFMGTIAISGAAAEPVGMQETLNWRAFSIGGHNRRHRQQMQREKNIAMPQRRAAVKMSPIYARFFSRGLKNFAPQRPLVGRVGEVGGPPLCSRARFDENQTKIIKKAL